MKSYPPGLLAAENIPNLVTITRGSEVIRINDSGADIPVGSDTWTGEPGVEISRAQFPTDGSVSTVTVQIAQRDDGTTGPLDPSDAAIGRYDGCPIQVACVDPANTDAGTGEVFTGYIGKIGVNKFGKIQIDCSGPLRRLRADRSERYGPMCRWEVGDAFATPAPHGGGCRAVILPPDIQRNHAYVAGQPVASFVRVRAYANDEPADYADLYWEVTTGGTTALVQPDYTGSLTPGATVNDGGAVLTARNAFLRAATVDQVLSAQAFTLTASPDPRAVDDWFTLGAFIIRTGRYAGTPVPIRRWTQATKRVDSFFLVSHMIEPGTKGEVYRGCAKTEADCNVFGQITRRRAEPFMPGLDAALAQA